MQLEIGTKLAYGEALGKIIAIDGGEYTFCTPGGNKVKMGLLHLLFTAKPLTEYQDLKLREYEVSAILKYHGAYQYLPKPEGV